MTKPDFIIIGAMKCATSTLHSQLAEQPGIFMTTPKEPNFFSDDEQYARGIEWYQSLFTRAEVDDLCGESSTHYTKLPDYPLSVERMAAHLHQPKLIYVMRHPIDRLISHYIHQWSQNQFKCNINQAIDKYDELVAYSCFAQQLKPYIKQFGITNILPIFLESVKVKPQYELEKIARFIGCTQPVKWQLELPLQNISQQRIRHFLGYKWIIESNVMTSLRRNLIPQSIRDKVKQNLTMQEYPVLDNAHMEKLTELFNADLKQLGEWMEVDLNCANFAELALSGHLTWKLSFMNTKGQLDCL